ncbi:hypothetical protein PAHAL_3G019400 [Panicum hallii]|uniref:Uncharacterized protein n=1 Tax=Panicum hallii TaxID=206008 RepID=A0A2T8KGS5_9POAL|nr:hypothetical protein PAHAL_3G019400 [Panicum hallii]
MAASSAHAKSQNFRLTPKSRQHHSAAPFAEAVTFWSTICSKGNPEENATTSSSELDNFRFLFLEKVTR